MGEITLEVAGLPTEEESDSLLQPTPGSTGILMPWPGTFRLIAEEQARRDRYMIQIAEAELPHGALDPRWIDYALVAAGRYENPAVTHLIQLSLPADVAALPTRTYPTIATLFRQRQARPREVARPSHERDVITPYPSGYSDRLDAQSGLSLKYMGRGNVLAKLQTEAARRILARRHAMSKEVQACLVPIREVAYEEAAAVVDASKGTDHTITTELGGVDLLNLRMTRGTQRIPRRQLARLEEEYGRGFVEDALWPKYNWEDIQDDFRFIWRDALKPGLSDGELRLAYTALYLLKEREAAFSFLREVPADEQIALENYTLERVQDGLVNLPSAAEREREQEDLRARKLLYLKGDFLAVWGPYLRPEVANNDELLLQAYAAVYFSEASDREFLRYLRSVDDQQSPTRDSTYAMLATTIAWRRSGAGKLSAIAEQIRTGEREIEYPPQEVGPQHQPTRLSWLIRRLAGLAVRHDTQTDAAGKIPCEPIEPIDILTIHDEAGQPSGVLIIPDKKAA